MNQLNDKCGLCGAKPRQVCPALGVLLCSVCCGSKRGVTINCGADCGYDPFSVRGYDLWLKIDDILAKKMLRFLASYVSEDDFKEIVAHMSYTESDDQTAYATAVGSAVYYFFFVEKADDGLTLSRFWQSQGWPVLNNDERRMMECRFDCRVTIIEVQKVLDNQRVECIDLFDPGRGKFILVDRCLAAGASRFLKFMSWLVDYPNFSRLANNGVEISDEVFKDFMAFFEKAYKQEHRKDKSLTKKYFLSECFGFFCGKVADLVHEKTIAMLNNIDLHQCTAVYKLQTSFDRIKAVLDGYPDFEPRQKNPEEPDSPDAVYYSWLRKGRSKELEKRMKRHFQHDKDDPGVGSIGNVVLYPDKFIVEVFSKPKYEFAKNIIKEYFEDDLVLQNETVVDLAKQMAEKIEEDPAGYAKDQANRQYPGEKQIPLDIERQITRDFYKRHYTKFLDDHIPALGNMTPRQAAKNLLLRPKLIELMKSHLLSIERQNKDKGLGVDINWVLEELDLPELK